MGDLREADRSRQRAINAFVEAAAALTTSPWPTHDDLATALLNGALGLHLISKLDGQHHGLRLAEETLKIIREQRRG